MKSMYSTVQYSALLYWNDSTQWKVASVARCESQRFSTSRKRYDWIIWISEKFSPFSNLSIYFSHVRHFHLHDTPNLFVNLVYVFVPCDTLPCVAVYDGIWKPRRIRCHECSRRRQRYQDTSFRFWRILIGHKYPNLSFFFFTFSILKVCTEFRTGGILILRKIVLDRLCFCLFFCAHRFLTSVVGIA